MTASESTLLVIQPKREIARITHILWCYGQYTFMLGIALFIFLSAGTLPPTIAIPLALGFTLIRAVPAILSPYSRVANRLVFDDSAQHLQVELYKYGCALRSIVVPYSDLVFTCYTHGGLIKTLKGLEFNALFIFNKKHVVVQIIANNGNWSQQNIDAILNKLSEVGTVSRLSSYRVHKMYGRKNKSA